jgi:integrase
VHHLLEGAGRTLTRDEQQLILRATAKHLRDHAIVSLALGTGLRLGELAALNVGDVFAPDGTPRVRVHIRREIAKGGRAADVFLPERLVPKLARFYKWKGRRGEATDPSAPLFCAQFRRRLSKRRIQFLWRTWQKRAGFDRLYGFHALRHHGGHERLPGDSGPVPRAAVRSACIAADDDDLYPPRG